jgi:hypothetical protein
VKNYSVQKYQEIDYEKWNAFIAESKNATFLFHRDFMEYHKDRFEDFSIIILDGDKWVGVLPANVVDNQVFSHQGLTYGGLVFSNKVKAETVESILDCLLFFLKENTIKTLHYNPIPSFYFPSGNTEMDFLLIKRGAVLVKKEMNLAINLSVPLDISKSKLKHFRKYQNNEMQIVEGNQLDIFWEFVLEPRLLIKHQVKPVHSKDEILFLNSKFPENIKQYSVWIEDDIVAGITIFETDNVVKSQYGATTIKGEALRALDFLFIILIEKYKKQGKLFFDMGTVSESNESGYNAGLLKQKEELGCTVFSQDYLKLDLL